MSKQGFGGDDDEEKSDIERLLDGFSSAKSWYESNKDLFERFTQEGELVDLDGGDPISEAHVDEEKVLIVADVSGVNATDLELSFYNNKVEGKLGTREFTVDVPNDVDEDSIEADMKNGVLRVELDREDEPDDDLTVDTVDHTDDTIDSEEEALDNLEEMFENDDEDEEDDDGGDS